jgi:iron complex outermembrane recepter protein
MFFIKLIQILSSFCILCLFCFISISYAEPRKTLVVIKNGYQNTQASANSVLQNPDPASLLSKVAGGQLATGGGISSLPIVRGLNDDRVHTLVNGAKITSACANHMNPPLSYVDPFSASLLDQNFELPSVANFGDAIGDTIEFAIPAPQFNEKSDKYIKEATLSGLYRSNGDGFANSLNAQATNNDTAVSYAGSYNRSNSYNDGNGRKVFSTQYSAITNTLSLAKKFDNHLSTISVSTQKIPYQGFPNQYMDMVDNLNTTVTAVDNATYNWGSLDSNIFFHDTNHQMGFFSREKVGQMPMISDGRDYGYSFKLKIPSSQKSLVKFGTDFHRFELEDRWPAVPGSMMMSPNDFLNINNGRKNVIGNYAEFQHNFSSKWTSQIGLRYNFVQMDTGNVQGYTDRASAIDDNGQDDMDMSSSHPGMEMMEDPDIEAAQAFNQRDRERKDNNISISLQQKYEPDLFKSVKFGYTRKVRSPNMYERYAWGRSAMATAMIGWYGDANGYVGNIDLDPETAHTVSTTISLHDASKNIWNFDATPYISYVDDFIDASRIGTFNPKMDSAETRQILQFGNHDARLYGFDIDGSARVIQDNSLGTLSIYSVVGMVRGTRVGTGTNLYRMMPLNARLGLEHSLNNWDSLLELKAVARKSKVDSIRVEPLTAGFAVLNFQTSKSWKNMRFDFGITNLLDTYYEQALGGVDYAGFAFGQSDTIGALPGAGRSFNAGFSYVF